MNTSIFLLFIGTMDIPEMLCRLASFNIDNKVMKDNCNRNPFTSFVVVVVGVNMDSEATQTLKTALESTNAMLRANTKACNHLVK
jgi:hypothetical protein